MSDLGHRLAELRAHAERAAAESLSCDVAVPEARDRLVRTLDALVVSAADAVDALHAFPDAPRSSWQTVAG